MAFKSPLWEGVHVVALVTPDMDTTMRFWHEVLGAEIVATESNDVYRAYYFRVGEVQTVAFLEYHGVDHERYAKPAGVSYPLASQFDHLGLNLGSEAAVSALRARLIEYGCEVSDVVDRGIASSIYFTDPTGIALCASWWAIDLDAGSFDDLERFADPDPVPALLELRTTGKIDATPRTSLVDDVVREPSASRP
jgi:catechol 2,3-dioxygenase-like lactoylglutathione lyase family enzyme